MLEIQLNQQELLYISLLLTRHADDLNKNQTLQVNQDKYALVDNSDFAKNLSMKALNMSIDAPKVEEKRYEGNPNNDKEPLIDQWNIVNDKVFGFFYNRSYASDGLQSHTSKIKSIDGNYVFTQNSKYKLGEKDENPHSWIQRIDSI